MTEARLINTPYLKGRELHFSVAPYDTDVDMASICKRCNLNDVCFGTTYPHRKKAHINLDSPRIKNITTDDTSNCGIILDIVARKSEVQKGFIPKLGYSTT